MFAAAGGRGALRISRSAAKKFIKHAGTKALRKGK